MQQRAELNERDRTFIGEKLKNALGAEKVKDDDLSKITYSSDVSPVPPQMPSFVVFPENRDDVVAVLRIANEYKAPITVMSGGVNVVGTTIPVKDGIVVDLHRMNRIIDINTDGGYAVIEPGVNFERFTAALREKGYRCSVPTTPGGATPVGNYLSRPTGSLCNRHLDMLLDLEAVLPDGTILNTGSSAFPNAGSGLRYGPFPDLAGLFCCSYGTLGIVTKAAVRIYPINEANRIVISGFDSFSDAIDYVQDVTLANIAEQCITWSWQFAKSLEVRLEGEKYIVPPEIKTQDPRIPPEGLPYDFVTVFMSGYEETMRSNERVCAKIAKKHNGRMISKKEMKKIAPWTLKGWELLYQEYRTVEPASFGIGKYLAWLTLTEPRQVKEVEKWAMDEFVKFGTLPVCYYTMPMDFGRAHLFRIFCYPDPANDALVKKIADRYREMYQIALERYGGVPQRCKSGFPTLGMVGGFGKAMSKIKEAWDPNGIMSPNMGIYEGVEE